MPHTPRTRSAGFWAELTFQTVGGKLATGGLRRIPHLHTRNGATVHTCTVLLGVGDGPLAWGSPGIQGHPRRRGRQHAACHAAEQGREQRRWRRQAAEHREWAALHCVFRPALGGASLHDFLMRRRAGKKERRCGPPRRWRNLRGNVFLKTRGVTVFQLYCLLSTNGEKYGARQPKKPGTGTSGSHSHTELADPGVCSLSSACCPCERVCREFRPQRPQCGRSSNPQAAQNPLQQCTAGEVASSSKELNESQQKG
jgi:hypothetical protein